MTESQAKLFWSKVHHDARPEGCWRWTKGKQSTGYGQMWLNSTEVLVHRVSYMEHKGECQELDIDHKCGQRDCVNPDHLEAVTSGENIRRARARTLAMNYRVK